MELLTAMTFRCSRNFASFQFWLDHGKRTNKNVSARNNEVVNELKIYGFIITI